PSAGPREGEAHRAPLSRTPASGINANRPVFSALAVGDCSGPVISVLDGDTIEVLHNTHPERIRFSGIDCPEKGQAFGTRAKQAASALVFGRDVILQTHGQDKYGRTLADVLLPDGTNVNHELVKEGWCWWYRNYSPSLRHWRRTHERPRRACGLA